MLKLARNDNLDSKASLKARHQIQISSLQRVKEDDMSLQKNDSKEQDNQNQYTLMQSISSRLTNSYNKLHMGHLYQSFHKIISDVSQPKNVKIFHLLSLVIGATTLATIVLFTTLSQSYLYHLINNYYLLNLNAQLGGPIFNSQGSVKFQPFDKRGSFFC